MTWGGIGCAEGWDAVEAGRLGAGDGAGHLATKPVAEPPVAGEQLHGAGLAEVFQFQLEEVAPSLGVGVLVVGCLQPLPGRPATGPLPGSTGFEAPGCPPELSSNSSWVPDRFRVNARAISC